MKINSKVTELLCDLSEIESSENKHLLAAEAGDLRGNLLRLYRATDSDASKETITEIMTEAGYPWFAKLAGADNKTAKNTASTVSAPSRTIEESQPNLLSDEDFLDLLPANSFFH